MKLLIYTLLVSLSLTTKASDHTFKSIDSVYRSDIMSVQLHYSGNEVNYQLTSASTFIYDQRLVLKFDVLERDYEEFTLRLVHCDWNWQISQLTENEFIEDYNEFAIHNMEESDQTQIEYIHYQANIPRVKIAGNFVLAVYEEETNRLILTKRFHVYHDKINVTPLTHLNLNGNGEKQSLHFQLDYQNMAINNPLSDLRVVIVQNGNYQRSISLDRATSLNQLQKKIEYSLLSPKEQFYGGNEFRAFDIRSLESPGLNVNKIDTGTAVTIVYLRADTPKSTIAYQRQQDLNGQFVLSNSYDERNDIDGNYVYTYFVLNKDKPYPNDLYLYGALTNWKLSNNYKFRYDDTDNIYYIRILLKQGFYNYTYLLKDSTGIISHGVDGSFSRTENNYEVLVYYRSNGQWADELVGYAEFSTQLNR